MAFTDDHLRQLKEELAKDPDGRWYGELPFLVKRLEAAEVIAADHASIYPNDEATKRWLRSKGE